jgi:uncharacterized protein YecE (DUF72 family)
LERYAARFNAVEINSSFYRPHQPKTYARWAAATPDAFRFSVKIPKRITHEARLCGAEVDVARFVEEVTALGNKLGVVLVQLPPSLAFDESSVCPFFRDLRQRLVHSAIVVEPRHASWFEPPVADLLEGLGIGRVAADPALVPAASEPAGAPTGIYYRLHGSPRIYFSAYDSAYLATLAERLKEHVARGAETWCIFDNTALATATENALELLGLLRPSGEQRGGSHALAAGES